MKRRLMTLVACVLAVATTDAQMQYSTGAVDLYHTSGCRGDDLLLNKAQANNFSAWYSFAGLSTFSRWSDGNVFGSDFRDGANADSEPNGGSDRPNVYFYSGHGTCQNPPTASDPDFISACGNFGDPDRTSIGESSLWGNDDLDFMFVDASCPMDLVSIDQVWFGAFSGLHMAIGHSGISGPPVRKDTLDSASRGGQFAMYTVASGFPSPLDWLLPEFSVGDAWMATGTIDIDSGCCAVALAAGNDRSDAIDRRENERVLSQRSDPAPNWFAWKWICR
jgi:hypothetical protein